ncbi:MAG: sialidase family protein, partial [Prosthecobacter sp.]|nr:sialidase family protein [Prosthecobacter sp.]
KKPGEKGRWPEEKLQAWQAAHNRLPTDAERQAQQGAWMLRSTDGGVTWSPRYPTPVFAPHGPIQLVDGRLLYAGKELFQKTTRMGVAESKDDGLTWQWLAAFPTRPGDKEGYYAEPHLAQAGDGRIVVHLRNENTANFRETLQCESRDGGKTWSELRPITWGMPAHLLKLRNGGLLTTYGHRRKPFGVQARLSRDHGETWSEPMVVCDDAANTDHGYPSTVELADGTLLTVWYEVPKDKPHAVLRQARWKVTG